MGGNRMKKNLIVALALVFVLGIAGTAFAAANPFVDVPAKHWAYDAVSKLAKAGILDGYGDGTYRGERLASRYEMAQATAKAMARADKADAQMKALIDKLAVEFAAELNNLGVRVAKLEKNASSIKFWGDSRIRYQSGYNGALDQGGKAFDRFNQRIRVYTKADLNDKAAFYGRLMAQWTDRPETTQNGNSATDVYWDYGYFEWTQSPSLKVAVGRQQVIAGQDLFWTNGGYDSIQFKFGAPSDKFEAKVGYGDVGTYDQNNSVNSMAKELLLVDATYKFSKMWSLNGTMYWGVNADNAVLNTDGTYSNGYPFQVWQFGVTGKLSDDFKLKAAYFENTADAVDKQDPNNDHSGWMAELWFKGADKSKVGSWGIGASYRELDPWSIDLGNVSGTLGNSMTSSSSIAQGQKGWALQANYTFSKNAVLTATYEALKTNNSGLLGDKDYKPFFYLQMNMSF